MLATVAAPLCYVTPAPTAGHSAPPTTQGETSAGTGDGVVVAVIQALVNGVAARVKIDSGSSVNLISTRFAQTSRLTMKPLPSGNPIRISDYSGTTSTVCEYSTETTVVAGEVQTIVELFVTPSLALDSDVILGTGFMRAHDVQFAWKAGRVYSRGGLLS